MSFYYISFLFLFCLIHLSESNQQPLVTTKLGQYSGHYLTTISGLQVLAFNGIRYAKPPQRFKEAEMIEAHEGVYDASEDGDDCFQIAHNYNKYPEKENVGNKTVGSEDCLFLNIYTPNADPSMKYPVMVWIHGGGYMIGTSSSVHHGPQLLLEKEVVLVAISYRLDIFGFLSYDDDYIPGNFGLKDQSLALHWVKENIAHFGGDPESITIFGESAGGSSVHLQMHSPHNKGIFHRAISQSGSIGCPWSYESTKVARENALQVAAYLGCPTHPQDLLSCLQKKTSQEILDASLSLKKSKVKLELIFKPVIEGKSSGFITEEDLKMKSTIPWMSGVTNGEGLIMYSGDKDLTNFNAHFPAIVSSLFGYSTHPQSEKITAMIKKFYLGKKDLSVNNLKQVIEMLSDGMFIYGQLQSVIKHEGQSYMYLLTHEAKRSLSAFNPFLKSIKRYGVSHADDLFYLFPMWKLYPKLEFNEVDSKVQKLIVELWTNFAKHGNPTPDEEPKWMESEHGKYFIEITTDGVKQSKNMYSSRMQFWNSLPINVDKHSSIRDEL